MADNEPKMRVLTADERAEATKRSDDVASNKDYKPRTAQSVVSEVGPVDVSAADERAREAGVTDAAFVNYEEALHNYEQRPDVEPLKERRAREGGRDFSEAAFRRQVGGTDNSGVVTSEESTATPEDKKTARPAKAAK